MSGRRGVTLVEILIALALVAIVGAVASGNLRGFLDHGRLGEAVSTIRWQVEEGRRLAKRLDRDVTVRVEAAGRVVVDGRERTLPVDVVIDQDATIVFRAPFGTYDGADVTLGLRLRDATASFTITGVLARVVVVR